MTELKHLEKPVESIKKLEKVLKKIPVPKLQKFENLQKSLFTAKKWSLALLHNPEEDTYFLPYITTHAKKIIENFYTFEAKHPHEGLPGGLKLEKMTHHAFCNIPVQAGAVFETEKRTDRILFYPVDKLVTEVEHTFIEVEKKKPRNRVTLLKIYEDTALKKILLYKIETFEFTDEVFELPEKPEEIDLATLKSIVSAIHSQEIKDKVKIKDRTAIYKEEHPVDDWQLLSESSVTLDKAEIVDENGEVKEFRTKIKERPVAFTIFGIGFEKEMGWFPGAMIINVFKRKDILSKKSSPEEYTEKHTYHLNGKKLQVNYKNLYLKGVYGIDKIPSLWSYASLTANSGKLNITIPIPIQRKIQDKETKEYRWQRTAPKSIAKAVEQILGTQKINYKGEEIYLPGKRAFIEKELLQIKEPSWLPEAQKLIKSAVTVYKTLQKLKRGIDYLNENVEDISELEEFIPVKEIKNVQNGK